MVAMSGSRIISPRPSGYSSVTGRVPRDDTYSLRYMPTLRASRT
jgi:hypothetical protein